MNKKQRTLVGEVVSDKMDKTIVVKVSRDYQHTVFKKVMRRDKKYQVHDEHELAQIGDRVEIFEGRPASKTKHMYLSRIVNADK